MCQLEIYLALQWLEYGLAIVGTCHPLISYSVSWVMIILAYSLATFLFICVFASVKICLTQASSRSEEGK